MGFHTNLSPKNDGLFASNTGSTSSTKKAARICLEFALSLCLTYLHHEELDESLASAGEMLLAPVANASSFD